MRERVKKFAALYVLTFLHLPAVIGQTSQDRAEPLTIGEVVTMYSDVLKEERTLNIYLPQTYDRAKAYLFSHYLIVSPSLWWDDESMLNATEALFAQQPDTDRYVFVAVGAHDDKIMQREALAFSEMLKRSKKKHLKTDFLSMEEENHATILHNCIYGAFLQIFPYKDK